MGIAPEDHDRVFGPFERGSGAEVRAIPGTGLGLTITKLLTQVMGGEISLASTPGQGTTFTVRLLLSEAMQDASAELSRHIRGYGGPRRRIFVVDDDPLHVQFMRGLLVPLGFVVMPCTPARKPLPPPRPSDRNLVMMDLSLPDRTGWEVLRELRADTVLSRVRVLVVSANAHEYAPGSQEALHDGFVMKPVKWRRCWPHCRGSCGSNGSTAATRRPLSWSCHRRGPARQDRQATWKSCGSWASSATCAASSRASREFEAAEPAAGALAQSLRAMVERFDMKRYMTTIRELRENG